ncbi:MAG: hypothetical protein QG606_197, partial [Patescibacteria group bacterium]|nr:hypothetical protein [Patescibacteria group bacterium]
AQSISATGLADAIHSLLNDALSLKKQGKINRERAENFTWKESARLLETLYRNLIVKK